MAKDKLALITSMLIFGTIGLLRRHIPLPSGALAMLRGFIGAVCIIVYTLMSRRRPDIRTLKRSAVKLLVSGACIGLNWMLLFEAYNHTSVATATLCYYMAPVIVTLLSPVILRERLSLRQIICAAVAVFGMALVSGIFSVEGFAPGEIKGVLLGLGAAALYASVILINKRITDVAPMDRTVVQLFVAAVAVVPYVLVAESTAGFEFTPAAAALVLTAGVIHTGVAYVLYFGSITRLRAQTVALISYIDPVFAVILSAVILREPITAAGMIGAAAVIGAMMISELPSKQRS